ncbi:MAG: chitobiase/beta-hexosaminidase C-terminal domain-containing protein [Bacteroidales bacterium]|nr:chitobiase/beta-hexosaminidase C-terminal domain-containing protein [Bacteroidales bacterium]
MMKKLLTFFLTALLAFGVGWADEATFTVSTYNTGTLAGAPSGVSAEVSTTASQMGNGGSQLTNGKNYTLTLKGFSSSYKLTGIKLNYCTNKSSGAGSFTAKLGTSELGSYSITKVSSNGTTPRDAVLNITETPFDGSDLVLRVSATVNSVYVISFTVTYAENGGTQPAEPNWYRKVTDVSDLVAGKKYIFITGTTGMGAINNNGYGASVTGLTIENNRVNIGGTDISEFTLGGASDAWTFKGSDEKYLGTSSTSSTVFSTSTNSSSDGYKWKVTSNGWIQNNLNNNYIRLYSNSFCFTTSGTVSTIYVQDFEDCATPTFNPGEGTYTEAQNVSISCATSGATIYYTTDGTTPTTSSAVYSSAITVNETTTIKAIAVASGYDNSAVAEATYTINSGSTPTGKTYQKITSTSDLTDGNYLIVYEDGSLAFDGSLNTLDAVGNTFEVTISDDKITTPTPGYFTYDATAHSLKSYSGFYIGRTGDSNGLNTSTSEAYTNSISFDNGNANIVGSGGAYLRYNKDSGSTRFRYYKSSTYAAQQAIQLYKEVTPTTPKVATPTFSPEPGTYTSAQTVTISSATEGATIHYTYNGGSEQTGTSPITLNVNSTATIVAWATLTDYDDSEQATATYTIDLTPTMTVAPTELTFGTLAGDQLTVTTSNLTAGVNATVLNTSYSTNTDKWTVTPNTLGTDGGLMTVNYGGRLLKSDNTVRVSSNGVADVDVPVHYKHSDPIYIVTSSTNWNFSDGIEMNHSGDVYSYTLNATTETYLVFTKKVGNDVDWNSGYLFGPVASGDWWLTEESMDTDFAIDSTAYHVVKMHNGTYTITLNAATNKMRIVADVHAPVFSHEGGRYYDPIDVEITSDTYGAHIYYTLDGSEPSANNGTLYTGPVTISDESTTLKAVAIYGDVTSPVTSATYTIKPVGSDDFILVESTDDITAGDEYVLVYTSTTGVHHAMSTTFGNNFYEETTDTDEDFTLADGVVTLLQDPSNVNVLTLEEAGDYFYIKDHDSNYLYYTGSNNNVYRSATNAETDGYKWQMTINSDGDVVIRNVGTSGSSTRYLQSNPSSNRYACYKTSSNMFDPKLYKKGTSTVLAPQITPAGGTSNKRFESVEVTMTAAEGCTIYYTLDGSAPTVNSDVYDPTEGLTVPYGSAPTTVKAIAVDGEGNVSKVTTVVYYWDRVKVAITPESQQVISNVEVTITPTPSDATVTYQVNGGAAQTYTGPFTVTVTEENPEVTVVATATKGESTATATATYTLKDGGVNSIAEFNALSTDEEVFFKNPVTVLFEYSQFSQSTHQDYIWIKDRTGYAQLFIQPSLDPVNDIPKYENGDVIPAGFMVKKGYFSTGQYYQGQCYEWQETFRDTTAKALADPEQVNLSQLLQDPAKYNDRYLYINKLKVSNINGLNFRIATDEDGDGTAEVSGGSDVVGYNKYHDWKNKQGQTVGVTLPDDGEYYNVTFIFQKWQGGYEIMPIEFTPWVDNSIRLEDLVEVTTTGGTYTISNPLQAVKVTWDDNHGKFAIFAKDDEMYKAKRKPLDGQETYLIRYQNGDFTNTVEQADYDQSNWIEILIPSEVTNKLSGEYESTLSELQAQFENKILPGGSIEGAYVDALNPTIDYNSLTELPSDLATSEYTPNIYTPANFLMENIDTDGAKSYRDDELGNQYFFMMDGKPQEMGLVVWCYYPGNGDYFYITERIGDQVNGHQFHGSFKADMSLCEDPNVDKSKTVAQCFDRSNLDGNGIDQVKLYGFNAIVRKNPAYNSGSSNGAPRRVDVAPYYEGTETNPAYIVYPLNAGAKSTGTVTSVAELASSRVVESVRYYNIMGMESVQPFEGINIVVTRYSDGSSSTAKVLR